MSNPGCGCDTCEKDTAEFWPPDYNTPRQWKLIATMSMEDSAFFYWSFMWHCFRNDGWGEWYECGDELI